MRLLPIGPPSEPLNKASNGDVSADNDGALERLNCAQRRDSAERNKCSDADAGAKGDEGTVDVAADDAGGRPEGVDSLRHRQLSRGRNPSGIGGDGRDRGRDGAARLGFIGQIVPF